MKLRTKIDPLSFIEDAQLAYSDGSFFMGSCFSNNIGGRLETHKFATTINPLGIVYNPHSLMRHTAYLSNELIVQENDFVASSKGFSHFDFHGSMSSKSVDEGSQHLTKRILATASNLQSSKVIFLTLGTSMVFDHQKFGIVNNCHKIESSAFTKRLLSYSEIKSALSTCIQHLNTINPNLKIVFTVSPIRHTRNGLTQDRLSKSLLIAAIHDILKDGIYYFPSYEMVIDDLRDYRFYTDDLIHPSAQAIDYIWEHFLTCFCNQATQDQIKGVGSVLRDLAHRPMHQNPEASLKFKKQLLQKMEVLDVDGIDFSKEISELRSTIND